MSVFYFIVKKVWFGFVLNLPWNISLLTHKDFVLLFLGPRNPRIVLQISNSLVSVAASPLMQMFSRCRSHVLAILGQP